MISGLYKSFIFSCISDLEKHPPFAKKTKRLKQLTKVASSYHNAMSEFLLHFLCAHEEYYTVQELYYPHEDTDLRDALERWVNDYEDRCKTYVFTASVNGDAQRISRTIQVPHDATLGTLGLAVIESLQGKNYEFYLSHGNFGLYPAYFGQELQFIESDPYETSLMGFDFGSEPFEMLYGGLTITLQLQEIRTVPDIYVPQSYYVLGGEGLNLCAVQDENGRFSHWAQSESNLCVPMDIRTKVEAAVLEYEASFLVPAGVYDDENETDEEMVDEAIITGT